MWWDVPGSCVSCTLEDGRLLVYDVAKDVQKPVIQLGAPPLSSTVDQRSPNKHSLLRTHERCSDYYVVLGFDDGELRLVDLRRPSAMYVSFCARVGHSGAFIQSWKLVLP